MLWKYKLIDEAEALGQLGEFFMAADGDDIRYLRQIITEWNQRRNDAATDLKSVAISSMFTKLRGEDDQFEHAFMVLFERALEADTVTLQRMAQALPPQKGRIGRLNSRQRCKVKRDIRALEFGALDDAWPSEVPVVRMEEPAPQKEKPVRRVAAKSKPKAKAKAKASPKPTAAKSRRKTTAAA